MPPQPPEVTSLLGLESHLATRSKDPSVPSPIKQWDIRGRHDAQGPVSRNSDASVFIPMVATPAIEGTLLSHGSIAQNYGLKSAPVSFRRKAAWVMFTMSIFMMPYIILKACFRVHVSAGAWQTSVTYGMLMALDFMAVISFSAWNRGRVNTRVKKRDPHWVGLSTGVLVVGYREDPVLLESCLKSLRAIRYQRNQRILLVVDGNDLQDEYMSQIFIKVFEKQGATVFRPNFLCKDRSTNDSERRELVQQIAHHPGPVCVMQPHHGKRSAMYTGFVALLQQGVESVVVTDSDTYLDPHVCKGMDGSASACSVVQPIF